MGANQSRGSERSAGESHTPFARTCYYELLDVTQHASEEEIKRAYRRKALELHPDRNLDDVESATKRFADVQVAYELLSDPQERAWYDSHRDFILTGGSGTPDLHEYNVRVTTTHDVLSFLRRSNGEIEFSDSPTGFYGALRDFFATLAREEESICQLADLRCPSYPSFGHADASYAERVRAFYSFWTGFATNKSFSWKDLYRLSDAPDRRVRRLMEKENKRTRDEAVREFNDAVRSLVAFAKKRDPRVPASNESEFDRQKVLRDATVAQAIRSKLANQAKISPINTIPDWTKASEPADDEFSEEDFVSAAKDIIECVICRKSFKSEKQFEAHERSKKHLKAVNQIYREMRQDTTSLKLDQSDNPVDTFSSMHNSHPHDLGSSADENIEDAEDLADALDAVALPVPSSSSSSEEESVEDQDNRSNVQDEAWPAQASQPLDSADHFASEMPVSLEERGQIPTLQDSIYDGSLAGSERIRSKVGMAKAKRAKKKAQKPDAAEASAPKHLCVTCQSGFASKTKLFAHIKEFDHAQAPVKLSMTRRKKGA